MDVGTPQSIDDDTVPHLSHHEGAWADQSRAVRRNTNSTMLLDEGDPEAMASDIASGAGPSRTGTDNRDIIVVG